MIRFLLDFIDWDSMRYILRAILVEGSHNGSAAVLKTAGRKAMQVRVLSPPPFLFRNFIVNLGNESIICRSGYLMVPIAWAIDWFQLSEKYLVRIKVLIPRESKAESVSSRDN